MARDLNEAWGWISRLVARVSRLESGAMLENSSITNGRMRFIGGLLRIDSGGRVEIVGLLNADGTVTFTGPFNGTGTLTWTGPANIQGTTQITGALTVSNTFVVTSALVSMSSAAVFVASLTASGAIVAGSLQSNGGALISGTLTNSAHPTTSSAANVFMTTGGQINRVTSSARYKIDPQLLELPDSILDVPMEWWIDLGEAERLADLIDSPRPWTESQQRVYDDISLRRVPGFIAEKVESAGGEAFVNYTPDGDVDGIMYDRFVGARTDVLARRANEDRERIAKLEQQVADLTKLVEKLAA